MSPKHVQVVIEKLVIVQRSPCDDDGNGRARQRFPSLISIESSIIDAIEDAIKNELSDQGAAEAAADQLVNPLPRSVEHKQSQPPATERSATTESLSSEPNTASSRRLPSAVAPAVADEQQK